MPQYHSHSAAQNDAVLFAYYCCCVLALDSRCCCQSGTAACEASCALPAHPICPAQPPPQETATHTLHLQCASVLPVHSAPGHGPVRS